LARDPHNYRPHSARVIFSSARVNNWESQQQALTFRTELPSSVGLQYVMYAVAASARSSGLRHLTLPMHARMNVCVNNICICVCVYANTVYIYCKCKTCI
jgi:hypothetical protein